MENATTYTIYYASEANIDKVNISVFANSGTASTSETSYTITDLANGTTHYAVVTAMKGNEESTSSSEISFLVQEYIQGYSPWPTDTGVDFCAADTSNLDCPIAEYPGQDGDHQGVLPTYVKVSSDGGTLEDTATEWACVQDQHSGLLWEVKVDDNTSLHHYGHTFTWYQPSGDNGGNGGATDSHLSNCLWEECNTNALVEAINNEELCGYTDWRLPTSQELMSLSINRSAESPVVNTDYFRHATEDYWTSVTLSSDSSRAWTVRHRHNNARVPFTKESAYSARLVRGEIEVAQGETSCLNININVAPTTPTGDFVLNDDGTVIHRKTGLMWMRCSIGQTWNQADQVCEGSRTVQQWQKALQAADTSEYAGHTDWRLPNLNELDSIVELACWNPSINNTVFPNTYEPDHGYSGGYWTSTPTPSQLHLESGTAWAVNFESGNVNEFFRDSSTFVMAARLVRTPTAAPTP